MVQRLEAGERLCDVAAAIDLSTTTVRRWWRRYQQGWSSLRIARDLHLPLPTVVHVQRRLGLARCPRPAPPPVRRYERAVPGELIHLDIKKLGRFRRVGHRIHGDHGRRSRGSGVEFLHIAIDDRTRLAYAALFPDETAVSAAAFLVLAHRWFAHRGVAMQALLTDKGSAYRGLRLGALGGKLGLRHQWTRPYRPQTNGKAERFIRTCLGEWASARSYATSIARASARPDFLRYYKQDRFHMGLVPGPVLREIPVMPEVENRGLLEVIHLKGVGSKIEGPPFKGRLDAPGSLATQVHPQAAFAVIGDSLGVPALGAAQDMGPETSPAGDERDQAAAVAPLPVDHQVGHSITVEVTDDRVQGLVRLGAARFANRGQVVEFPIRLKG
jgi:transposase InsO family protein